MKANNPTNTLEHEIWNHTITAYPPWKINELFVDYSTTKSPEYLENPSKYVKEKLARYIDWNIWSFKENNTKEENSHITITNNNVTKIIKFENHINRTRKNIATIQLTLEMILSSNQQKAAVMVNDIYAINNITALENHPYTITTKNLLYKCAKRDITVKLVVIPLIPTEHTHQPPAIENQKQPETIKITLLAEELILKCKKLIRV